MRNSIKAEDWARWVPPGPVNRLGTGVATAALIVLVISCSGGSGQARYLPRVAKFGDSLSFEAEPYYRSLIQSTGETELSYDSFGGTAICDWLPRMREVEVASHPVAVQLQFSGNALTLCMHGYTPPSQAYYDKYRADTQAAITIFVPAGAHVYLIGAPSAEPRSPTLTGTGSTGSTLRSPRPTHST